MPKKSILVADDSAHSRFLAKAVLQMSYRVMTARDGQEAVDKAVDMKPDLIVLDIVMPRLNGFQALRLLRSDAATMRTPVIFATEPGELENVEASIRKLGVAYVTKPINAAELLTKVEQRIGLA